MTEKKARNLDRHVSSQNISVRLDNDLIERLTKQAEKEGRSRRAIIVEVIENYLSENGDWKIPFIPTCGSPTIPFTSDVETVVNAIELTLSYDSRSERYDDCMYRRKLCNTIQLVPLKQRQKAQNRLASLIPCNRDSRREGLG